MRRCCERDHRFEDPTQDGRLDEAALAQLDGSDVEADDRAPEAGTFGLRVPVPTGEMALRATNLGIRYNLNLTKKTKLQTTFANLLDPRRRPEGPLLGAARRQPDRRPG